MRNHLSIDGSIEQKCVATGRQSIEVSIFSAGPQSWVPVVGSSHPAISPGRIDNEETWNATGTLASKLLTNFS